MNAHTALPGSAAYYTRLSLRLYDAFVVHFTTPRAWRCDRQVILEHYQKHCAGEHAEVGVGTGYFLSHLNRSWDHLSLVDPNPAALTYTSARLTQANSVMRYQADILDPSCTVPAAAFKSVAANYLLHCLPGPMPAKEQAIQNLANMTADDGALFGATVLGAGVAHNRLGRVLMSICNRIGAFGNEADTEPELRALLEKHFAAVEVTLCNTVALFAASNPKRRTVAA